MGDETKEKERGGLVLVARKGCLGLPTACPSCLSVYLYLRFANASFELNFDRSFPDSDHIPFVELGDCVAYNNEKGGVIEGLKEDGIVDWLSAKANLFQIDILEGSYNIRGSILEIRGGTFFLREQAHKFGCSFPWACPFDPSYFIYSKPKTKAKRERTVEEKTFRRRVKYFLATQLVAVLVFLTLLGGSDSVELEMD